MGTAKNSDVDANIQSFLDAIKPVEPPEWMLSTNKNNEKFDADGLEQIELAEQESEKYRRKIAEMASIASKYGDGTGCIVCHGMEESAEYPGTCAGCGLSSDPAAGELLEWLKKPERNMRCQCCGQKTMAKMPDGEYRCYDCRPKTEEKDQRPPGAMLGDFLSCDTCGSKKIKVFPSLAKCEDCKGAVGGELAKLAAVQLKTWRFTKKAALEGQMIKVFDMRELASKIENLDSDDSDSKGRIKSTIKKLAVEGEFRALSTPQVGWSALLDAFSEMHPNFHQVLETNVRPSLSIAAAGGKIRPAPALLLGEPGVGKSFFAECLARHLGVSNLKIDLAVSTNGASLAGSSAFWSNSCPGEVFKLLAFGSPEKPPVANPVIFVDEVDKVDERMEYNPLAGLYSLLEVESAKHFEDQSLTGIHLDASNIRWLLACNGTQNIPAPILSRVHVFEIPELTPAQKRQLFTRIFQLVVESTGLELFDGLLPEKLIRLLQDMGMREFKNLAGVAIGRALEEGRWRVEQQDFWRPGFEVVRAPMGFR